MTPLVERCPSLESAQAGNTEDTLCATAPVCMQRQESWELKEGSAALSYALFSLLTGAVTISRQRTRMLCCLVRTLLSPALRSHHGRALINARGLCVPPAAGADEF